MRDRSHFVVITVWCNDKGRNWGRWRCQHRLIADSSGKSCPNSWSANWNWWWRCCGLPCHRQVIGGAGKITIEIAIRHIRTVGRAAINRNRCTIETTFLKPDWPHWTLGHRNTAAMETAISDGRLKIKGSSPESWMIFRPPNCWCFSLRSRGVLLISRFRDRPHYGWN